MSQRTVRGVETVRWIGASVPQCAIAVAAIGLAGFAPSLCAQSWGFEVAFDQAFTSLDEWDSPSGFSVSVGASDLWQGIGMQLNYRTVSEAGGEVPRVCGFASCSEGPFTQRYFLGAIGIGVSKAVDVTSAVEFVLSLNASVFWQSQQLRLLSSGEQQTRGRASDYGVGPSAALRFPRTVLGIRPLAYARYDRVIGGSCPADGTCYGDRDVGSVGVGLSWGM